MHGASQDMELLKTFIQVSLMISQQWSVIVKYCWFFVFSQKEQDSMQKVTQEVKHHEDNIKFLKSHVNAIDESIHSLQGELKECHSSNMAVEVNDDITFVNSEKQTIDQIRQLDQTAASIICQVQDQHGLMASTLRCTKDIVGILASLGKVNDKNLSRLLSEYLGLETMLAIVCKTFEGVQALERHEKDGTIDRNAGLHGIAPTIGRTLNGRFTVYCLQNMRPFVGEFLPDDPQKKLAILNPRLPNGKHPPGFLGYAVNMISLDDKHLSCVTVDGHGLRETLFYNLFSRLQIYKTRSDMLCALPFITDGAISLDGGMIEGSYKFYLGDRSDSGIQFPIAEAAPSLPNEVSEIEQQIKFMEWKKEMLSSDIQREEALLNNAKSLLKAKSDGYRKLINDELLNNGRNTPFPSVHSGTNSR
ncbi:hypothetical protein AXF42_Ash018381 [Apostasia shenzhenica]|uniref:Protein DEFECTIVE IN MERISTEM SILENCING 3 n=1 Tax=Apostasia shenzhenica TaxID=1088818 RepID=A0A2H9ZRB1_9ASPA|nr:hypothetical protein AXF42_Ash018381 [Apostasia shenzhenica]